VIFEFFISHLTMNKIIIGKCVSGYAIIDIITEMYCYHVCFELFSTYEPEDFCVVSIKSQLVVLGY